MDQRVHLRGVAWRCSAWRLAECQSEKRGCLEGKGPARSRARTEYTLEGLKDGGIRFDYVDDFMSSAGAHRRACQSSARWGMPEREAIRTLERLRALPGSARR